MREVNKIDWTKLETGKKGSFHIYTAQFLNGSRSILAGSWKPNDLRLYSYNSQGTEFINLDNSYSLSMSLKGLTSGVYTSSVSNTDSSIVFGTSDKTIYFIESRRLI